MLWLKNILLSLYFVICTWIARISNALYNTEEEILKAKPGTLDEKNKYNIRKQHNNPVIEKMFQGQRDEKYVKDYYEILKKADQFLKNSTPEKIEMAVDKHSMNLGKKDKWGRRYDHYGFFDPKNKNYGKTMSEVIQVQINERKTSDDDYPIEFMFNNKSIINGLSKFDEVFEIKKDSNELNLYNEYEEAINRKFPMVVIRKDNNVINKIEKLTEFLHVKKIGSDVRLLEFFIDKKYMLYDNLLNKKIMNELTDIEQVWINDEYDGKYGFLITEYCKYFQEKNYDILKFKGNKIEKI